MSPGHGPGCGFNSRSQDSGREPATLEGVLDGFPEPAGAVPAFLTLTLHMDMTSAISLPRSSSAGSLWSGDLLPGAALPELCDPSFLSLGYSSL